MGFLDKLFGKKTTTAPHPEPEPTIQAMDGNGRPIRIPREAWRTNVLPGMFRERWDDADGLAGLIAMSLHDGFAADALAAARRLAEIDATPRRAANLLVVTLIEMGRLDEAERTAEESRRRDGEDAPLLFNLAKIARLRGRADDAARELWRSVETDPNYDASFGGWLARERDAGRSEADALRRIAALPGSWRAQIWLARTALSAGDVAGAVALYRESLSRVTPMPGDALMQITGDLGRSGHLAEAIEICEPRFDAAFHGVETGNNLIKMHVELRDAAGARRLLELLYAQKRIDWRETLTYWDVEVDKLEKQYGAVPKERPVEIVFLDVEAPLWAVGGTALARVVPAPDGAAARVAFVCGSATKPDASGDVVAQPTDDVGRFTRGIALHLAGEAALRAGVRATTLVPWMNDGGFVLSGTPWPLEHLAPHAGGASHLVLVHVDANRRPWKAELRLVRIADAAEVARWNAAIDPSDAGGAIEALAASSIDALRGAGLATRAAAPGRFAPPQQAWLPGYVGGMEQALAVRAARTAPPNFLRAERSILDHLLDVALANAACAVARFLLLAALAWEKERRPDVVAEYRERVERLQRDHPLPGDDRAVAEETLARILA